MNAGRPTVALATRDSTQTAAQSPQFRVGKRQGDKVTGDTVDKRNHERVTVGSL